MSPAISGHRRDMHSSRAWNVISLGVVAAASGCVLQVEPTPNDAVVPQPSNSLQGAMRLDAGPAPETDLDASAPRIDAWTPVAVGSDASPLCAPWASLESPFDPTPLDASVSPADLMLSSTLERLGGTWLGNAFLGKDELTVMLTFTPTNDDGGTYSAFVTGHSDQTIIANCPGDEVQLLDVESDGIHGTIVLPIAGESCPQPWPQVLRGLVMDPSGNRLQFAESVQPDGTLFFFYDLWRVCPAPQAAVDSGVDSGPESGAAGVLP